MDTDKIEEKTSEETTLNRIEEIKPVKSYFPKKLSNINFALVLLCLAVTGQSMMVSGAFNVSISTIERAFRYNSAMVALVDMVYNVGFALTALILGYTIRKNKMRWIGFGMLSISVGCMAFIIPVFVNPELASHGNVRYLLCQDTPQRSSGQCTLGKRSYLVVMCMAYFVIGVGAAPLHTLAVSYVDEHTSNRKGGLFNGIYYSCAALGPAATFVMNSFFMRLPIRSDGSQANLTTPDSETWIGAYWLIYVVGSIFTFLVSIPLLAFPSIIPRDRDFDKNVEEPPRISISQFLKLSIMICQNLPLIFLTSGMFFDGMMNNSIGVFMAKIMEAQYQLSPGKAGLLAGVILVIGVSLGLFSGGFVIKIFNWEVRILIRFIYIMSLLGALSLFFLFMRCPEMELSGVQIRSNKLEFTTATASQCHCDIKDYFPVCVNETKTYYSPCTIGCRGQTGIAGSTTFSGCSGVEPEYINSKVHQGACLSQCKTLVVFLILGFISLFIEFIIYIPQITYTMRILDNETRLCGLSIQQIILRISYVTGPVIQGYLLDRSCKIFAPPTACDTSTNCINYELSSMALAVAIPSITCKTLATLFLFLSSYFLGRRSIRAPISVT